MATLATARSFLFAPGSDGAKLRKALASAADAVIADLEDAVVAAAKAEARELVARELAVTSGPLRLVRVNGAETAWFEDDLAAVRELRPDAVVLPKATPETARALEALELPVVAIVETPDGLRRAYDIASAPPVAALMLGAVDLALALGLERRTDGLELLFARSSLVVDSAAAGIRAPIDQVWTDFRDAAGLAADSRLARSLGLRGKACIHPGQVAIVNEELGPSDDDVRRAREIVSVYEQAAAGGAGAVALDGTMIDLPVVEQARRLLDDATRGGVHAD